MVRFFPLGGGVKYLAAESGAQTNAVFTRALAVTRQVTCERKGIVLRLLDEMPPNQARLRIR